MVVVLEVLMLARAVCVVVVVMIEPIGVVLMLVITRAGRIIVVPQLVRRGGRTSGQVFRPGYVSGRLRCDGRDGRDCGRQRTVPPKRSGRDGLVMVMVMIVHCRRCRREVDAQVVQVHVVALRRGRNEIGRLDEAGLLIHRRVEAATVERPRFLLGFAPRAAAVDGRHLRLCLCAVVHFGQSKRPQFGFNILQLLEALLVDHLPLALHSFGRAPIVA